MMTLPTLYRLAILADNFEAMQSIHLLAQGQGDITRHALAALDASGDAALHLPSMPITPNAPIDLNYGDTIEPEERQAWTAAQAAQVEADLAARNLCLRQHPGYLRVEVAERD